MQLFEEIGHREAFVVLTRRGNITRAALAEMHNSGYEADKEDAGMTVGDDDNDDESGDSVNSTLRGSACGSHVTEDDKEQTEEETQGAPSTPIEFNANILHESESDFESAGSPISLCSARESYSEGSTMEQSDMIGPDDGFWSNWPLDDGPEIKGLSDDEDWASPPEALEDVDGWDSDISSHISGQPDGGDHMREKLKEWLCGGGVEVEPEELLKQFWAAEALAAYDQCGGRSTVEDRVGRASTRLWS
ncbi:hypothetical protein CSOJ01_11338 [Colletotrichum sojae]|uniref:Uncharacterized protein n=1 Tax=Colletotrichum sojae TaxID=2175907 RepID=A0A8H6MNZ2_9PEZI|nr:hypothetical protein CSOJ01_11338 [Colletotrichum sojae]